MSLLVALLLGAVQGVFMFVPVSSTSHLVLTQTWLRNRGVDVPAPESAEMVLFDLVVHVGTLVSIVIVMRSGLQLLVSGVSGDLRTGRLQSGGLRQAVSTRLVVLGLLTTATTGALGLLLRDLLTDVFGAPQLVAVALIVTGIMLWWTDRLGPGRIGAAQLGIGAAVAVGVAQFAALTTGLSRSGTTIFVALLVGMHRTLAARYSFFVAIRTILAATSLQAIGIIRDGGLAEVSWAAMGIGLVAAAIVGTGALWVVLQLLEQARFRVFSIYVWGLALLVLTTGLGT